MRIAVVGGGLSGLVASYKLMAAGHEVTCFEASPRPGGLIRSEVHEGFLCEVGPQAILDGGPDVRPLLLDLGLVDRICLPSPAAKRRSLFVRGKLRPVPTGPMSLLSTSLLSARGKWRLVREPFAPRRLETDEDESVMAFATRRLGPEAARNLVAPGVIGLFAGDAARLSMRSAFPRVAALEEKHGSLLRGMKAARREGTGPGQSISFLGGMEELPRALAGRLGSHLVQARVRALRPKGDGWHLDLEGALGDSAPFAGVVLATSPHACADLVEARVPRAAVELRTMTFASVAVVALGFRHADIGMDLDSYGFLVARGESAALLGCQYDSTIFPGRAPVGGVLLRAIVGGTFHPRTVEETDDTLLERTVRDLGATAGLTAKPDFAAIWRWRDVLPQYELGHENRVRRIEEAVTKHPGLYLLGIGLRGVGLSDCVRNAVALAQAIGPA